MEGRVIENKTGEVGRSHNIGEKFIFYSNHSGKDWRV